MKPATVAIMFAGTVCLGSMFLGTRSIAAQSRPDRLVRIAELEIDPGQLEAYKSALREEIEASIRIEPGVLTLYAVAVKDQPHQIRLFEVYAGTAAYQAHLQSAHFLKYKTKTVHMVKALKLIETEPLVLGSK
jgi:quinol monooxygenase YgiN